MVNNLFKKRLWASINKEILKIERQSTLNYIWIEICKFEQDAAALTTCIVNGSNN